MLAADDRALDDVKHVRDGMRLSFDTAPHEFLGATDLGSVDLPPGVLGDTDLVTLLRDDLDENGGGDLDFEAAAGSLDEGRYGCRQTLRGRS